MNRYKYKFFNSESKVVAVSSYAGKAVKGVAKCDPRDSFDLEKGKKLAEARCNVKIAQKRAARAEMRYNQAIDILVEATREMDRMRSYFCDSYKALNEAEAALSNIERSM